MIDRPFGYSLSVLINVGFAGACCSAGGLELIGTVPDDRTVYEYDFNGRPTIEMPEDSPSVQAAFKIFDKIL